MEMRALGRTGIQVPVLSLGTMTWGEQNTQAEAFAQMDLAFDRGVRLFDAAELYPTPARRDTHGRTEEIIGAWLRSRGRRQEVMIASKVLGRSEHTWYRDGGVKPRLLPAQVREACEKSLKRLGVETIDLYQVHWPDRRVSTFGANPTVFRWVREEDEVPIEETLYALGKLVLEGKVRHIGISNESAWGAMTWLRLAEEGAGPRIVSIQNAYSLVNRTFEVALAEIAMRENLGLIAYSTLAQGNLTGKYAGGALPAGARKTLYNRMQRYETPGAEVAVSAYLGLASELGLDPAQLAIAYVASRPFTTTVLLGATSTAQLEHDLDAAEVKITPEIEQAIDAIHLLHQNPCP